MDPSAKIAGLSTPRKSPRISRSKVLEVSNVGENENPNLTKSRSVVKSGIKDSSVLVSPRNLMRERRFVVAKRKGSRVCGKCKEKGAKKCMCVAYESLRASQETFCEMQGSGCDGADDAQIQRSEAYGEKDGNFESGDQTENPRPGVDGVEEEESEFSSATLKRTRDKLMEEARESVPESGSGRVMHLVKAFENLLSMRRKSGEDEDGDEQQQQKGAEDGSIDFYKQFMSSNSKVMNWALPGMQLPKECDESHETMSSFCPSDLCMTSEKLGLDSRSSLDTSFGSFSVSTGAGGGGRRSRRNSTESCGSFRGSRRKLRVTDQKPFKLRTEQRGRMKEEELMNKILNMMEEQERMRIPIAQGLPWTTDEPECLVKPPVKESTRPIDLKLHSDVRAVERAEFDHQVAEKMSLLEQYRMELERQQKLAEEEEIRRLRKELIPKAQPMPYFDRPFIPRRSEKHPTVAKEPNFHIPQHKKIRCMSLTDFGPCYTFHQ